MNIFGMPIEVDETMLDNKVKFVNQDGSEQVVDIATGNLVLESPDDTQAGHNLRAYDPDSTTVVGIRRKNNDNVRRTLTERMEHHGDSDGQSETAS